jgi:hypothetical protein
MSEADHYQSLPEFRVTFPGPFEHHDVVVDGWRVPHVQAHLRDEDRILLVLDRRLGMELSTAEAERFVPFLADAIAIALGYGAHPRGDGDHPLERAPFPRPERVFDVVVPGPTKPEEG